MQKYFKSKIFNNDQVNLLTALRSRMFNVKYNFRGKYYNLNCRFLCHEEETQHHIFSCEKIRDKIGVNLEDVEYKFLFSSTKRQKKVVEEFERIKDILEEYPI